MANKIFSAILMGFIIVIVGVAFLNSIGDSISLQTEYQSATNETLDISGARYDGDQINESYELQISNYPGATGIGSEVTKNFDLYNDTTQTDEATVTTDYVFNSTDGTLTLVNNSYWVNTGTNTSSVDYDYTKDDYIPQNSSRVIIALVLIFGAIGILIAVGGPTINSLQSVARKMGR